MTRTDRIETNAHGVARTLALVCLMIGGCNQADPPAADEGSTSSTEATDSSGSPPATTDADSGSETATPGTESSGSTADADFFPLSDGATWTYRHTAVDGTTFDEIVVMRETTFNGAVAFEMEDNAGANGENTVSTIASVDGQSMRVHKAIYLGGAPLMTVDYTPGFLRFDNGWVDGDITDWSYDRVEYDASGAVVNEAIRQQIYTIESMSTEVTVPAGTFDCVQFLRERPETGDAKRFWFADGIGKIKDESLVTGSTEELTEYNIP